MSYEWRIHKSDIIKSDIENNTSGAMFKIFTFAIFICSSCSRPANIKNPAGYDLSKPETVKLPSELNEISGITFNSGKPDSMYAVQDEEGRLFYFSPGSPAVKSIKFGKKGDYEDLSVCNGTMVILRADGALLTFPLNVAGGEEVNVVQEFEGLVPKAEYEAMFADESSNEIFVLCKSCKVDNAKQLTGYRLQLNNDGTIAFKNNFVIDSRQIADQAGGKKGAFRPSAIAKNKLTSEWFILSSVNKMLVVMDDEWRVKDVYPLDAGMFAQPEGIAFDLQNNLYISNERVDLGGATVLKFIYTKK